MPIMMREWLDKASFTAVSAEGQPMTWVQAIAYALTQSSSESS